MLFQLVLVELVDVPAEDVLLVHALLPLVVLLHLEVPHRGSRGQGRRRRRTVLGLVDAFGLLAEGDDALASLAVLSGDRELVEGVVPDLVAGFDDVLHEELDSRRDLVGLSDGGQLVDVVVEDLFGETLEPDVGLACLGGELGVVGEALV